MFSFFFITMFFLKKKEDVFPKLKLCVEEQLIFFECEMVNLRTLPEVPGLVHANFLYGTSVPYENFKGCEMYSMRFSRNDCVIKKF